MSSLVDKISKFDGLSSLINSINNKKLITIKDIDLIDCFGNKIPKNKKKTSFLYKNIQQK